MCLAPPLLGNPSVGRRPQWGCRGGGAPAFSPDPNDNAVVICERDLDVAVCMTGVVIAKWCDAAEMV